MGTVNHAFISSRLDYCNSLHLWLSRKLLLRLQLVQNGTARLLTGTGKESRIYLVLAYLHWLPVEVLTMVFKSLHGLAPEYIACLIQIQHHYSVRPYLSYMLQNHGLKPK